MTEEAVSMDQLHVGDSSSPKFDAATIKAKLFCLFGTLFLLIALVFLCASVAIQFGLQGMLNEGLRQQLVISPEYKEAYNNWLSTEDSPAKQYDSVIMYNLTNADDVIKYGAKPVYVELPRVVYRRLTHKFNVSFSRDMNTVDFREQDYFVFDPVESGNNFDPYTNYVVNINPSFLGVMIQTGGESGLMKNMAGPAANQILETLSTEFVFQFLAGFRHQAFLAQSLDEASTSLDHNMTAFVMTWSDASVAPNENFNYMLLSVNETEPTSIPIDTALQLWNADVKYSFITPEATEYQYWIKAQAGDAEARKMLMDLFKLTDFQLDRIVKWFFSYDEFVVFPKIQVMFPVETKRDLGWRQWGIGDTNPEGSVIDGEFGIKLPGIPEIKFFADRVLGKKDYQMDIDLGKRIFNGPSKPLFDQNNAVLFMDLYDKKSFGALTSTWKIDQDTATVVAEYLKYIMRTFVNDTLQTQVFDKQIGLISRKTVHEWLFEYTDPLLMLLQQPELAKNATLMTNYTSMDDNYLKTEISTINTGIYNISFVGDFVRDNGITNLYMWNEPVPIHGTDGSRFQPSLTKDSMVVIWFPQVLRPQNFTYRKDVEFMGIKAFEYRLQKEMSDPNPIYNNDFFAMANMTVLGSPIFVSKSRFLHSEPWWREQVDGVGLPNEDMDTILYVEPITGLAIYERKRVQINAYIQNRTVWFDSFYPNVPTGVMYPLAIIEEYSDIPEVLAAKFRDSVYLVMNLRFYGFWAALAVSSLFAIVASVLIYQYYSLMGKQKKQYQPLN